MGFEEGKMFFFFRVFIFFFFLFFFLAFARLFICCWLIFSLGYVPTNVLLLTLVNLW